MAYLKIVWILFFLLGFNIVFAENDSEIEPVSPVSEEEKEILAKHEAVLEMLRTKVAEQEAEIAVLRAERTYVEKFGQRPFNNTPFSGFLAVNTGSISIAPRAMLRFTTVRYNVAPRHFGYDNLGFYRCPYDGIYVFFVNVRTGSSGNVVHQVEIRKEAEVLSGTYTSIQSGYHRTMSAAAITQCNVGQDVFVYNPITSGMLVYASGSAGHTHFMGFRIY